MTQCFCPLVSIIIPVFNRSDHIKECVESALQQTYPFIEVIIVDNCSVDDTYRICEKLASLDSRIKLFKNDVNVGPVLNWKIAATHAKGEFIKVLFSDDVLHPSCTSRLIDAFHSHSSVGLVYCSVWAGSDLNSAVEMYRSGSGVKYFSPERYSIRMLVANAPYSPCASMMRRSSFIDNLYSNFDTCQVHHYSKHGAGPDCMVQLLTSMQFNSVVHVNEPLVFFRMHSDSFTMSSMSKEVYLSYVASLALFAKNNLDKKIFLGFLFLTWVQFIVRYGFTSPFEFFRNRESSGTFVDIIYSFFGGLIVLSHRLERHFRQFSIKSRCFGGKKTL